MILALISVFLITGKEPQPRPTILDSEQKLDIGNGNDQFTSGKNYEPIVYKVRTGNKKLQGLVIRINTYINS